MIPATSGTSPSGTAYSDSHSPVNCGGHYILVVEDSPVDFEILSRTFKKIEFSPPIHHCSNGDKALAFLESAAAGHHPDGVPLMILLDLNLPGIDGRQLLSIIKQTPYMKAIPVAILSTSSNQTDIDDCFAKGADIYLNKELTMEKFTETAHGIKAFWEDKIIAKNTGSRPH